MQEAKTGIVRLEEFDVGTFQRLLSYLYEDNYPLWLLDTDPKPARECSELNQKLLIHVHVAEIADYLRIDALRLLAIDRYSAHLDSASINLKGFDTVVEEVYRALPPENRSLKSRLCRKAVADWHRLTSEASLLTAFASCGEFLLDIMSLRDEAHELALRADQARQEALAEKYVQEWRKVAASKTRELERAMEGKDRLVIGRREVDLDLQKERSQRYTEVEELRKRLADSETEANDFQARMERAEADLEAYESEERLTDRTVGHYVTSMGYEHQHRCFEKLLGFFSGCCGDSPKATLAFRRGPGWVFRCRKCAKGYTITGPCARRMIEAN